MFRNRTELFFSIRKTEHSDREQEIKRSSILEEKNELMLGYKKKNKLQQIKNFKNQKDEIEMKTILPSAFDISIDLNTKIDNIKIEINSLVGLYKKLIISEQHEKQMLINTIQKSIIIILKDFEDSYTLIKKYEFLLENHENLKLNYNYNDIQIIINFKKNFALKVQENSLIFKNLQKNYIKFLKQDDQFNSFTKSSSISQKEKYHNLSSSNSNTEKNDTIQISQSLDDPNLQLFKSRDEEISNLTMSVLEMQTIFKEIETMIFDQGGLLDKIDYNLQNTLTDINNSNQILLNAKEYLKTSIKYKLILLILLFILLVFIIILKK